MMNIKVTLTDLTFPAGLEDKYCKFRPLISIRYKDSNNKVAYAREALPGLEKGDYWECEKDNKKKNNYVRHDTEPKVDMDKLDVTRREITFEDLDVQKLERVEVELFDIDVSGIWDKIRKNLVKMLPLAVAPLIPATLPLTLTLLKKTYEEGTGNKVADLEKSLLDKAIGRADGAARSIWVRSKTLTSDPQQTLIITGGGTQGNYSMTLEMEIESS